MDKREMFAETVLTQSVCAEVEGYPSMLAQACPCRNSPRA